MSKSFTREQFYELVWTSPMTHLAKEFVLSDVALHKICRKHGIPTPPPGWWAKKAAGKKVTKTALPRAKTGDSQTITIASGELRQEPPSIAGAREQARIIASETPADAPIPTYPIVERTLAKLEKAKANEKNIASVSGDGIIRCDVSEKSFERLKVIQLARLAKVRVFDPACGSGNFLVVAYRELRDREIRLLKRLGELEANPQNVMWSSVNLGNFHGIEITDFAAETAKLALFIAEYQANARFADVFGRMPALLPLRDGGHVVCDNALNRDWDKVCPPPIDDEEVYIAGNPPFLGARNQDDNQKMDMDKVFSGKIGSYRSLDLVAAWYFKAVEYIAGRNARAALVATNSVCQGSSVSTLWPTLLNGEVEVYFCHQSFKWRNNASKNAAVICVIVGFRNKNSDKKYIYNESVRSIASNINPYLVDGPNIVVTGNSKNIFGLPEMAYGNYPGDGNFLTLTAGEKVDLLAIAPEAEKFIRPLFGAQEYLKGIPRFCLWISDNDAREALKIPYIANRISEVRKVRLKSPDPGYNKLAAFPYKYRDTRISNNHTIIAPTVSSERREYLPCGVLAAGSVTTNQAFAIFDGPLFTLSILNSRIHIVWIAAVCGKLKTDLRYSNTLGWNTFPAPRFTDNQLEQLTTSARCILKARYQHYPATIAELYDPANMPADLRQAHQDNDDLLEDMYIGRPFRNDTERLEKLFKLYAAKVAAKGGK